MADENKPSANIRSLATHLHLSTNVRTPHQSSNSKGTSEKHIANSGLQYLPAIKPSDSKVFADHFRMGGLAAAATKAAFASIEIAYKLLQKREEKLKTGHVSNSFKGVGKYISGVHMDWRGNNRVIRFIPIQALNFAINEHYQRKLNNKKENDEFWQQCNANISCGGIAGICTLLLFYRLDYVIAKACLANEVKKGMGERQFNFKGLVDVYRKTPCVRGLGLEYDSSFKGVIVYRGLYFGMYDSLKPVVLKGSLQDNFYASFALGVLTTHGANIASHPFDIYSRRRTMTFMYKNSFDAFRQIAKNEGVKSLFKGAISANFLHSVTGGCVLAGYDMLWREFGRRGLLN